MADEADMAVASEEARLAGLLSGRSAVLDPGVAGECEGCGEIMPRLVGGQCGYCRDGRQPPPSRFDTPPPAAPPTPRKAQETTMTATNSDTKQTISVPAEGAALAAIRELATAEDLPLGRAVLALVERAIGGARPTAEAPPAMTLATVETSALMEELTARIENAVDAGDYQAIEQRAVVAEEKLATIQAALGNG